MDEDRYNLNRFRHAQRNSYNTALAEIRRGRKISHWMWYIFPQIDGLGVSETAQYYAISGMAEAQAYLSDPTLGEHLVEISRALMELDTSDASEVFGYPDDMKLRSSMTLFSLVPGADPVFAQVLDKYYGGEPDDLTLSVLGK
jgi:uncharacterized protein (DUF1810 family)